MKGNEGWRVAARRYVRCREVFFVHFVSFQGVKGRRGMTQ